MRVCNFEFNSERLRWIQSLVDAEPGLSRRELSRKVCERFGWRRLNGQWAEMSCHKALCELERRGVLRLCGGRRRYAFERPRTFRSPTVAPPSVCGPLSELGEIEIVLVPSRNSPLSVVWNELMDRFHPLGKGPLRGEQLRYLIRSERYGWLGGLAFSASVWKLRARDAWIGWSEAARWANLREVVNNSRFLILPTVAVKNLASHVLAKTLRRLPEDWEARYGHRPVLVETFVNPRCYGGTCYRAAGWKALGRTRADQKRPFPNKRVADGPKDIYVKPLTEDWRERLCAEPVREIGQDAEFLEEGDWAEEEFGAAALYDARLTRRLCAVAKAFYAHPGASATDAFDGDAGQSRAAYRFFENERTSMETVLAAHREATVRRARKRERQTLLAVQDTTTINYTPCASLHEEAGPLGGKGKKARGFFVHDTLLFDTKGVPLGLLDVQCWARPKTSQRSRKNHPRIPTEEKESFRWIQSFRVTAETQKACAGVRIVSVGDREAGFHDLFVEAQKDPDGPELLVRLSRTPRRVAIEVEEESEKTAFLWEYMQKQPIRGFMTVLVPQKKQKQGQENERKSRQKTDEKRRPTKRRAKLAVRYAKVVLPPPDRKALPSATAWIVYVKEENAPAGVKEPLEWMLLTIVETETVGAASERVSWYAVRWGVEVYHHTFKTVCRVEDRRLRTKDALLTCLAVDMVVAWRVYALTKQGRETPEVPCDEYLSEFEYKALWAYIKKEPPPAEPYPLGEAYLMVGRLGGHLSTAKYPPGVKVTARGLKKLRDIARGYQTALAHGPPPI